MVNTKNKFSVSVVIPNFNGKELLRKNLPFLLVAQKNTKNYIAEIIVVDDGSVDGSVALIKDEFPEVKVIKHTVNRGFVSAVNTGVRGAKGGLIALVNNDVTVRRDFLQSVVFHFNNPDVFAVSLHEKGFGWARGLFKNGFVEIAPGEEARSSHTSFWANGGSAVFRRSYWTELGGMDEELLSPFYWEDIDICYRALKRGLMIVWEPQALVSHEHESTIKLLKKGYVEKIKERNQLLFIWKNITSPILFRKHIFGLLSRVVRHPGYLRIVLMALSKLKRVLKRRSREKKDAKVSDEAIFARFA